MKMMLEKYRIVKKKDPIKKRAECSYMKVFKGYIVTPSFCFIPTILLILLNLGLL
jgi:hypothetical protein